MIDEAARRPVRDIFDLFQAFVGELDRQRALVRQSFTDQGASAPRVETDVDRDFPAFLLDAPLSVAEQLVVEEEAKPPVPLADPEYILDRLQAYLEAQFRVASRRFSDLTLAQYREVQYAMAALADDLFINDIAWDGREAWRANHLEHRLFQSRLAGDRIFSRIDALLASGDRRLVQLASVYLCILSLGFRGRYRGNGGEERLRDYSERLFAMISGREPALLSNWSSGTLQPVILSAYQHTLKGDASRHYAWRPRWFLVLAAVALAWAAVGEVLWLTSASPISNAAAAVLRAAGDAR